MDGGGRLLRSLTAGPAGGDGAWRKPFTTLNLSVSEACLRLFSTPWRPRRSVAVPLGRRLPRFLGTGLALGFLTLVTGVGLSVGGHLEAYYGPHGGPHHLIGRAFGFGVERITIAGIDKLRVSEVLEAAGVAPEVALPFLSAADARQRLEAVPLVKSASVRKLYPDELIITLTEREPHALWQHDGELYVIAADGTVIDQVEDGRFAHLPHVVGEEANRAVKDYLALLDAAGPLKNRIRAGSLVAGRRWTLKTDNGIDVRLPELGARAALQRLVKLHAEHEILEKDVIAIDLRMPDRVVVRITEEAMAARLEALKKKPLRGKGVET